MPNFTRGQLVLIRCEVQKGAFPTEYLVTLETSGGPLSGFVRKSDVENISGNEGFLRAIVRDVSDDTITVMVEGSFFTTTGLAYLRRDWANSHVQPAHA